MPNICNRPIKPDHIYEKVLGITAQPTSYRLGGPSCLSGDVIGDHSIAKPLQVGDRLMFEDMAIYTMVKNSTFNGIPLPAIALHNSVTDELKIVKRFG